MAIEEADKRKKLFLSSKSDLLKDVEVTLIVNSKTGSMQVHELVKCSSPRGSGR
jgi:hypothetical protein